MNVLDTLLARNEAFATTGFSADLKIVPSLKTMIIGCVDTRVDPADILGVKAGEAVVIRNVGGRIEPATLHNIAILSAVTTASGGKMGQGWNLIVLHHTDCGIKPCLGHAPELLATYFDVPVADLDKLAINDPYASVAVDVAALKANPNLSGDFMVSGLVYDVKTGRVETVVPPALLRPTESTGC
ncbi:carbonic anhydrase [Pseudomonas sp. NA-150]|uniref:carbonic anhydrase n=1 Tax=Pseudomonas sp. NA-150 TaxID=3367525 RepID=UPI0037C7DB6D